MPKLHEILAVEATKEGRFKETLQEMTTLFKSKTSHFAGFERTLKLLGEDTPEKTDRELAESEHQAVTTTVPSELDYLAEAVGDYFDIMLQRDEANQRAVADIIIDGEMIALNVPATTLLALENKLKQLRPIYDQIPTLQPGVTWEPDPTVGDYIYKDKNPEYRTKTKKSFEFKILVQATDKFPAQTEKWESVEDIGVFTRIRWSSMISVADKSKLLARFDALTMAVKQARQRANEVEINQRQIGSGIFKYLNKI